MTGLESGALARGGGACIAYLKRSGHAPGIVWLGGFKSEMSGTKASALDAWAERARQLAAGTVPEDLEPVEAKAATKGGRDVYLYVISGFKERNPAAAKAIIERL